MSNTRIRFLVLAFGLAAWASTAAAAKLDGNIDAVKAAIDPANGAPIAEPRYPDREYGGPGPYTPEAAVEAGFNGVGVIECNLALSGKLSDCKTLAEGPLGLHFGDASLKLTGRGYMTAKPPPNFADGQRVRVIVVFRVTSGG